ncbi:MAG: Rpp14/Pop5 family protein [Candidatus Thermoplasmatota archaeon]
MSNKKKFRQRYIGFEIKTVKDNNKFSRKKMIRKLQKKSRELFGKDWKKTGIYLTRFNGEKGIVRCSHLYKNETINILKSIKKIGLRKVSIETVGTSGTIKSLIKKHMNKNEL